MMNLTESLAEWYSRQCDGVWEHEYGVTIETIDNPGWSVRIDLADTSLADESLSLSVEGDSEGDWYRCGVGNGEFTGVGGSGNLAGILAAFLEFVAAHKID